MIRYDIKWYRIVSHHATSYQKKSITGGGGCVREFLKANNTGCNFCVLNIWRCKNDPERSQNKIIIIGTVSWVLYQLIQYRIRWYIIIRYNMILNDTLFYDMQLYDMILYHAALLYHMILYRITYEAILFHVIWYNSVCNDMILQHMIIQYCIISLW